MSKSNQRWETLDEIVAWLRQQRDTRVDYKQHALVIVRQSLRLNAALDAVEKFRGARVIRNGQSDRRFVARVEGLSGIL